MLVSTKLKPMYLEFLRTKESKLYFYVNAALLKIHLLHQRGFLIMYFCPYNCWNIDIVKLNISCIPQTKYSTKATYCSLFLHSINMDCYSLFTLQT